MEKSGWRIWMFSETSLLVFANVNAGWSLLLQAAEQTDALPSRGLAASVYLLWGMLSPDSRAEVTIQTETRHSVWGKFPPLNINNPFSIHNDGDMRRISLLVETGLWKSWGSRLSLSMIWGEEAAACWLVNTFGPIFSFELLKKPTHHWNVPSKCHRLTRMKKHIYLFMVIILKWVACY